MQIAIGSGTITATLADGTTQVFNLANMVDIPAIRYAEYNTVPPILGSDPYTQPNPTPVNSYKVVLHFNDNRWLELQMGSISNQVTWTNDLTGANTAVSEISAAIP